MPAALVLAARPSGGAPHPASSSRGSAAPMASTVESRPQGSWEDVQAAWPVLQDAALVRALASERDLNFHAASATLGEIVVKVRAGCTSIREESRLGQGLPIGMGILREGLPELEALNGPRPT